MLHSYTLAGLLELADISLPEDFGEEEMEVAITGLQNRPKKVLNAAMPHSLCEQQVDTQCIAVICKLLLGMHVIACDEARQMATERKEKKTLRR